MTAALIALAMLQVGIIMCVGLYWADCITDEEDMQ